MGELARPDAIACHPGYHRDFFLKKSEAKTVEAMNIISWEDPESAGHEAGARLFALVFVLACPPVMWCVSPPVSVDTPTSLQNVYFAHASVDLRRRKRKLMSLPVCA